MKWTVLMTDTAAASAGGLSPRALTMLEVEAELTAKGIPVGWDPYRPGEGFEGFHLSFAFPRPLHMLVRESGLYVRVHQG